MENEVQKTDIAELVRFDISTATIAEIKRICLGCVVKSVDDKVGRDICYSERQKVKTLRVSVEKRRKELKQESLEFGRMVDAKARELSEPLEEIEAYLQAQQDIVDLEEQRKKDAAHKLLCDRADDRFRALNELGAELPPYDTVHNMAEDDFAALLVKAVAEKEQRDVIAENERKALEAEQERQRVERAKLEEERKEAQARAAQQEEENRKLREQILEKEREENRRLKEEAKEREAREAEARQRIFEIEEKQRVEREAEQAKKDQEEKERQMREEVAARKVRDEKLLHAIMLEFPTIEAAWVEIISLREYVKTLGGK